MRNQNGHDKVAFQPHNRIEHEEGRDDRTSGYGYNDGSMTQAGGGYDQSWRVRGEGGPHAGKGPKGFQRTDERIKEMVDEALTDDSFVDATHITVEVKDREVTLSGTVDDRATKRRAEAVVEAVSGVKDIHNQLRLTRTS